MNVGNKTTYQTGNLFYPILLTVRNGIEVDDYNQDLENNAIDVVDAVQDRNRSGASIIHVVKNDGINSFPVIIECNNINGVLIRSQADNTVVPGDNLVATNHFRTLYSPVYCSRYDEIADSLVASTAISSERSWSIFTDAAGIPNNLHAIQYNVFSHALRWATTVSMPAYLQNPTDFNLDILFNYQTSIENQNESDKCPKFILVQNYPNSFNMSTTIEFSLRYSQFVSIKIYNCRGEEVVTLVSETLPHGIHTFTWNASGLTNGVYLCRLTTDTFERTKKLLLLK